MGKDGGDWGEVRRDGGDWRDVELKGGNCGGAVGEARFRSLT